MTTQAQSPTSAPLPKQSIPRLALSIEEACASIGVSWDFWDEHIAPSLPVVRAGRRKLVPVSALERWLTENASTLIDA